MNSFETAVENINALKEMGVQIALDDFGTGYTSLSYVSKLPIDLIKIDKSFINDINDQPVNHDFINAVIQMGHLLNCEVICEGVETEEQLGMLKEKNCDFIQGFLWGEPLRFEDASALCMGAYSEKSK
jgi:EAL domain-containing protein (putative c-di-GMP-specific phosphodiesterase class I)